MSEFFKYGEGKEVNFEQFKTKVNDADIKQNKVLKKILNIFDKNQNGEIEEDEAFEMFDSFRKAAKSNNNLLLEDSEVKELLTQNNIKASKSMLKSISNFFASITSDEQETLQQYEAQAAEFTEEEVEELAVQQVSEDVQKARQMFDTQRENQGAVSDFVDGVKETFHTEYAASKVERVIKEEELSAQLLQLAQEGKLTEREYLERKLALAKSLFPPPQEDSTLYTVAKSLLPFIGMTGSLAALSLNISDDVSDEEKEQLIKIQILENALKNLKPEELNVLITNASQAENSEEQNEILNNLVDNYLSNFDIKTHVGDISQPKLVGYKDSLSGEFIPYKEGEILVTRGDSTFLPVYDNITEHKQIIQIEPKNPTMQADSVGQLISARAEKLKSFEETFRDERGVEYDAQKIEDYARKNAQMQFVLSSYNKITSLKQDLNHSLVGLGTADAQRMSADVLYPEKVAELNSAVISILSQLNKGDKKAVEKILSDICNRDVKLTETKIKISDKDITGISSDLRSDECKEVAKYLEKILDNKMEQVLNGKTLEEYAEETSAAYKTAYGNKDISALAEGYVQSQQEGVQTVKSTIQTGAMLVMIAGQVVPVVGQAAAVMTMGGLVTSSVGGTVVQGIEDFTKKGGATKEDKHAMLQELGTSIALVASGMKIGKISESAFRLLVIKNCPKLLAFASEIGIDATMSLVADAVITGQVDLSGEGIAQLQNILVGIIRAKGNFKTYMNTHAGELPTQSQLESSASKGINEGAGTKPAKTDAPKGKLNDVREASATNPAKNAGVKPDTPEGEAPAGVKVKQDTNTIPELTQAEINEMKKSDSAVRQMPDGTVVRTSSVGKITVIGRLVNTFISKAKDMFKSPQSTSKIQVTKETINTVKKRFIYEGSYSDAEIAEIVELFKKSPDLIYEISSSPNKYDKSLIDEIYQISGNDFELALSITKFDLGIWGTRDILGMNKNNPNLAKKLLARDDNGEFKLSQEQQRGVLYDMDSSLVTEDFLDGLAILRAKGIENKEIGIFDTKEKVDALSVMSKYIDKILKSELDGWITGEKIDNIIKYVKTQEDVELIDKYLNKYNNNEHAQVQVLLTLNHQLATSTPEKQPILRSVLENLLDKNLSAWDIDEVLTQLNEKDLSNFDKDTFISNIKDTDNIETIRLLIATKDKKIVETLVNDEKYNMFSTEDKIAIAEIVEQENLPLEHVANNYEYYKSAKTSTGENVVKGCTLKREENLRYMVSLPDASKLNSDGTINPNAPDIAPNTAKSATAMRELADLVADGFVGNHVLEYLPKEGELPPLIAGEIHKFYEAYLNGEKFEDVLVPTVKSLDEASAKYGTGEIFEVEGESKIFIKGANGENIQLDMDKSTYCKLFPPIERYASTQNYIGNCWEITGFNTLLRDPQERSRVLQCFHQKGDDVVVEFPNSTRQYSLAGMQANANMNYHSEGGLGSRLLEYADGKELHRERIALYITNLGHIINDTTLDETTRNNAKKELDDFLALSETDKNRVYLDDEGNRVTPKSDEVYDGASTYSRDGGLTYHVFRRLGYNNPQSMWFYYQESEITDFLTNPENFKKHVVTYDPGGDGMENEINREKGIYSNHAYMITPNCDANGNIKDYNVLNPWGIVETTLTLDEIKKYGKNISIAER